MALMAERSKMKNALHTADCMSYFSQIQKDFLSTFFIVMHNVESLFHETGTPNYWLEASVAVCIRGYVDYAITFNLIHMSGILHGQY